MNNLPVISIALCTYNGDKYLKALLDSLVKQTYRNLEIVVVDDHSSDNTWGILTQFAEVDHRFRLYRNEENLGYNKNFEKALGLCSGEFIAICDQDDIWLHDKISLMQQHIGDHQLLYHDSELIDKNGNSMHFKISDKFNFYRGGDPTVFLMMNCVSGHSILMKKQLLQSVFPIPKDSPYDQWIAYVATLNGTIDFLNKCLVRYRQHGGNATDLLSVNKSHCKSAKTKIDALKSESKWLNVCGSRFYQSPRLARKLLAMSEQRNRSYFMLSYGWEIWKNQQSLLFLMKKNQVSRFFFALRKIWGIPAKMIWH